MSINCMLKDTSPLMKILAIAGIKPGAFWLQDAFCNLLATFTDSILAPRWRGSCFRRLWRRRARRCGWTSGMCLSRWTRPATAPSSSSRWLSTTSLTKTAPSGPGRQKVDMALMSSCVAGLMNKYQEENSALTLVSHTKRTQRNCGFVSLQ